MSTIAKFRDGNRWKWEAVERSRAGALDGDEAASALYFISRFQTRRCDRFPGDWERRSTSELLGLWKAAVTL